MAPVTWLPPVGVSVAEKPCCAVLAPPLFLSVLLRVAEKQQARGRAEIPGRLLLFFPLKSSFYTVIAIICC